MSEGQDLIRFLSPYPSVDIPDGTISDYVLRKAIPLNNKSAIVDAASGASLTYGDVVTGAEALSRGLIQRGLEQGSVVAILAPNIIEYPLIFHGVAIGGMTLTTLNPLYTEDEILTQLIASGACILMTVPSLFEKAQRAMVGTDVREIFVIGDGQLMPGAEPLSVLFSDTAQTKTTIDPDKQIVVLPYSSGTTGLPKGVMLTHRNLISSLVAVDSVVPLYEDDVVLAVLPFFHIYGLNVIMNPSLSAGATMVVMQRFDVEAYLQIIETHRVTVLYAAPPMVLALSHYPRVSEFDLSSVRWLMSGAAPLDATTARDAEEKLGCTVFQAYGMTEASPGVFSNNPQDPGPSESVGLLLPGFECRVVDSESGVDLGFNRDGEILIRGPQVMAGYLNDKESTRGSFDDEGYYRSGDIGHVDEFDRWYIVDRVKELIKYKGYQVAPAELEAVLMSHPDVVDAAVVGVSAGDDGEIPKAYVVSNSSIEKQELMDFVALKVAPYKRIREVEQVAEIPRSATGKILRRILRDQDSNAVNLQPAQKRNG